MSRILKLFSLLVALTCIGIVIGWFALGYTIDSGSLPKTADSMTHHTIPYDNHGTTYYLTDFQDGFRRWAIPVMFGVAWFGWLVGFIWKKMYDKTVA